MTYAILIALGIIAFNLNSIHEELKLFRQKRESEENEKLDRWIKAQNKTAP